MKRVSLGKNWNGTETVIEVSDDELISRDIQPGRHIQAILDTNAAFRAQGRKPNPNAIGRHVASVPTTLYYEWLKEWRTKHRDKWTLQTFMTMKLNNRDYSYLKTNEMRL
jgi:hypothetical protein